MCTFLYSGVFFVMLLQRWHNRTHTKGIIVDSARVLLGSHNWSYDGTVLNRDASLLFYEAEIGQYLEEIFIYDWENWSKS
jgi:phosphatidylserine/phosphatidylglycerophosphate/cardiolipin synthase-like enzyme